MSSTVGEWQPAVARALRGGADTAPTSALIVGSDHWPHAETTAVVTGRLPGDGLPCPV